MGSVTNATTFKRVPPATGNAESRLVNVVILYDFLRKGVLRTHSMGILTDVNMPTESFLMTKDLFCFVHRNEASESIFVGVSRV